MDSDGASDPPPPSCQLTRDSSSIITWVDDAIVDVLGWKPEDLLGQPSTVFIHPEDQPAAVTAWFDMLTKPGSTGTFRGRYRTADGSWRWIEVVNQNHLEEPDARVITTITPIEVHEVTVAEELRARKQMLALLADALPVGIFQFDLATHVTFSNDRFAALLGTESFATVGAALAGLDDHDALLLESAVDAVLHGTSVDALELHAGRHPSGRACVFEVSLRPLNASDGTISGAIGCLNDITERVRMRRALEDQATRDALTQCLNRNAILSRLDVVLESITDGNGIAVLFVDLDEFKTTNDDYGHAAGDSVLVEAARRLSGVLRGADALGRLGGDEFLVICTGVSGPAAAEQLARRVGTALEGPMDVGTYTVPIAATIGFAWTDTPAPRDLLVSEADHAMYEDKRKKRASRAAAA
jgi:diguanylate cyclase (GGDEF)-like protein/PAS domain S-box-containing protein